MLSSEPDKLLSVTMSLKSEQVDPASLTLLEESGRNELLNSLLSMRAVALCLRVFVPYRTLNIGDDGRAEALVSIAANILLIKVNKLVQYQR